MSIFREVTVKWNGEDHVFTPSLKFLRRLESMRPSGQRLNILEVAGQLQGGGAHPTDVTAVLHAMLGEAMGSSAPSEDEVYGHIMNGSPEYIHNAMAFTACVLPDVQWGKTEARAEKKAAKSTAGGKKSRGTAST